MSVPCFIYRKLGTTPRTGDEVLNTPKLDWQINEKEHASFLFHRLRWDSPGGVQTQTSNNYSIDAFGTDFVKLDYGVAKLDSLLSPTFNNEVRFQYGRELDDEGQQTWSSFTKAYLNNNTGTPVQLSIQGDWWDPWSNPRANYGNSTYDVPHRAVGWAMLTYPVVHSDWRKYIEDGWHMNPVLQIQNGLPYSYGVSGTITSSIKGVTNIPAAYSGINGSGNSGYLPQLNRNTISQPTTVEIDARLEKDIPINERFNLELVGEGFNLLNFVNVTGINSTAYSITNCDTTKTPSTCSLTYQPYTTTGAVTGQSGFGAMTNANSNFVYSQRQIQLGLKLDF